MFIKQGIVFKYLKVAPKPHITTILKHVVFLGWG